MALFLLDEDLAALEVQLPAHTGLAQARASVELAWHLRQRDPARARALSAGACTVLSQFPDIERRALEARLLLVESEAQWLKGELDAARALADQAFLEFEEQGDVLGRADARWLRAWIEVDRGNPDTCARELGLASQDAAERDAERVTIFDAAAALFDVFRDLHGATHRWSGRFPADLRGLPQAAAGWINDFAGIAAFQACDYALAIRLLMQSYDAARATGQVRRSINIATNIGNAFTCLNAHDAALEWMQRGLELSRPTGWPMCIGLTLMQTAETLRQLGQGDAALELLREALTLLARSAGSRAYAIALEYQGDLWLDRGDYAAALDSFVQLQERGEALRQPDFQSGARRGQAHALSMLGRPEEALRAAHAALGIAREHHEPSNQIAALKVLAEIHLRHELTPLVSMEAPSAALYYLGEALRIAAGIDGYTVPGDLLDCLARAFAAVDDYKQAYEVALQAGAARDKTHSQQATNRAVAMQVQYQTERARTDGEHHRQLAAAEARRAEVLAQTSATLEHLSAIGQEITTHLNAAAVFRALDRHVHGLLDATHFSVFLLDADGHALRCAFGVEAGISLPSTRYSIDDPHANSARAVRERREILIELEEHECTPNLIPGTLPTRSLLFAPLAVGERVLGVMTVQSPKPRAYGERERLIFRTLCAYGAIALDNAAAYRQVAATLKTLSATQAQLLDKNVELENANRKLEEVSLTDQLTGLRNRRFFLQHVENDVSLSLRGYEDALRAEARAAPGADLVFFMVDIDHFKEVNDRYGHGAGDAVLVQMQQRLREVFRDSDHIVRWGGEEFLVLARAIRRADAKVVAERMRAAVSERQFVLPDGTRLDKTCSIGFACFPFVPAHPRLLSWSEVVELADQGLYLAKRSGRNAWASVSATPEVRTEGLYAYLINHLDEALAEGEVELITNLEHPDVPKAAKKRRLGL
ncbi:MAG: diguanylate cyclase [Telluria sp.]